MAKIILLICACAVLAGDFTFFTDPHFNSGMAWYFNHKSKAYETDYLMEAETDARAAFVNYRDFIRLYIEFKTRLNAGRQSEVIVFNPNKTWYALVPSLEFSLEKFRVEAALDHRCYHNVDVRDETMYYNKVYVLGKSNNARLIEFRKDPMRYAWTVSLGYYLEDMFGLFDPEALSGDCDYRFDIGLSGRYRLYRYAGWLFNAAASGDFFFGRSGDQYQTVKPGLEAHYLSGPCGFMVFLNYFLADSVPFRPHDKLVELGFRCYL